MIVVAGKTLFALANLEKVFRAHTATQLRDQVHMLADVARQLAELRVLLHKPLHVGNRLETLVVLMLRLVLRDVILDVATEVAEIQVHVLLEERILVL